MDALDALLGDPLISSAFGGAQTPSDAQAWIRDTGITVGVDVTVRATQAAQLTATTGNEDCHIILRGGNKPNYDRESVDAACAELVRAGVAPRVIMLSRVSTSAAVSCERSASR